MLDIRDEYQMLFLPKRQENGESMGIFQQIDSYCWETFGKESEESTP